MELGGSVEGNTEGSKQMATGSEDIADFEFEKA